MSDEIDVQDSEPPSTNSFPTSRKSMEFYRKNFPNTTEKEWTNWKWQLKNKITTKEQLEKYVVLSDSEKQVFEKHGESMPVAITPYYMSLINPLDSKEPIRKCSIPLIDSTILSPEEKTDPLGEDHQSPVKCIVHRYPDRVLFLSTKKCFKNCCYCTRSRIVGDHQCFESTKEEWNNGFQYIQNHPEIRDVLVSGGDPLTLTDENIEYILSNIRKIEHVEMIRIGTKAPIVMPQRVTKELCDILKKYHPLYMSLHFTHPSELTEEVSRACTMLADSGIPLGSQTVLLKDINNNSDILKKLFTGLLKIRVRPYYTYICDLVAGSKHFRTTMNEGIKIFRELQGKISGYAIPKLIVDAPNGLGKIPVQYNYIRENSDGIMLENYEGKVFEYQN